MNRGSEQSVELTVNGEACRHEVTSEHSLLDLLRDDMDLTGAKKACDNGECGSCIVLMNGKPTKSCLLAAKRAAGKAVTTIEGLAPAAWDLQPGGDHSALHPLQRAFLEKGATQCGFCIPGMIMKANALLVSNNDPTREEVVKSLSKNLCRCTGYFKIIEAVLYASQLMRSNAEVEQQQPAARNGKAVGVSVPRLDSPGTVNGRAKYAADLKMDGMLHAKILRATVHHARILSIDTSEAEALPGVQAVITADDVPGTPYLPNCQPQTFVFPRDKVRFLGEGLAAVAAVSEAVAEAALGMIRVELEVLPTIVDLEDAARPDAPRIFDHMANVSPPQKLECGDIEAGFAQADVVVENTYRVPVREHAAMEPEAALAYEGDDGRVVIKTPLYHPFVQGTESIANNLAVDKERIQIICPHMGGNFGTRGDTLHAVVVALLTRKTGKPVRIVFSRAESMLGSCKAPSVVMKYRTGATRDGKIVAMDAEVLHAVGSWGPQLIETTTRGIELCFYESLNALLSHSTGPYEVPNVRAVAYDVLNNGPRYVPLRGTVANYLPLAYESQLELIAAELGMDSLEIRQKNAVEIGSRTHVGQVLKESVGIQAELAQLKPYYDDAKARLRDRRARATGPWKPGMAVACGWRNIGYVKSYVGAGAELLPDGRIEILAGTVEQGQGPTTQFAQIASDEIGVPIGTLVISIGDTTHADYPVPTFSSITTVATGKAVQLAAGKLRDVILEVGAILLDTDRQLVSIERGSVVAAGREQRISLREVAGYLQAEGRPLRSEGFLDWNGEMPNILYGYNAGIIELDVNEETGRVRLLNHVNSCDPGTPINPLALEGQVDGAVAFGFGFALSESFHPDNPPTLVAYGLPTTKDIPETITRLFVTEPFERGPFGAKSMAEHPGISPIPGIVNAIAEATGARVYDIPATPARVKEAIRLRQAAE